MDVTYTYSLAIVSGTDGGTGGGGGGGGKGRKRLLAKPTPSSSGYSGVVLSFVQNGISQNFGNDFTTGTSYGPVDIVFDAGKTV